MESHDLPFKIIFLWTGNSARGIFGEYLIRKVGVTVRNSQLKVYPGFAPGC